MMPMWASYIVKAYAGPCCWRRTAWRSGFCSTGAGAAVGLAADGARRRRQHAVDLGAGAFLVFVYIWLPFMILPIRAALERLPPSLLHASADLGARPAQTFRHVILPLAVPGIAAGSIFTFSLTLGDFIVPQLVGPPGYFIGSMVYAQQGAIGNMPMAAAFTLVPIVLIAIYLSIVKRLGAFDAL